MATVSCLIWDASSGWVIFFRFNDLWGRWIVTLTKKRKGPQTQPTKSIQCSDLPKRLSSHDNSSPSRITEVEEDPAWRSILDEMRYCSHHKTLSPDDQNCIINLLVITSQRCLRSLDPALQIIIHIQFQKSFMITGGPTFQNNKIKSASLFSNTIHNAEFSK